MGKTLKKMVDIERHNLRSAEGPLTIPAGCPQKERQKPFSESKFYEQLSILKKYFIDLGKRIYYIFSK